MPNTRLDTLRHWLEGLPTSWGLDLSSLVPASSDASFRRYFRLHSQNALYPTLIVMDAPPQSEPVAPFIAIAELLQKAGLHVPRGLEKNTSDGFLLLSDLGSTTASAVEAASVCVVACSAGWLCAHAGFRVSSAAARAMG